MLNHNIDVGYYVRMNEIKFKLILSTFEQTINHLGNYRTGSSEPSLHTKRGRR